MTDNINLSPANELEPPEVEKEIEAPKEIPAATPKEIPKEIAKEVPVAEEKPKEAAESRAGSFWEMVRFAALALIIVIPIRTFVAQPFIVSGSSMVPTFQDSQYLIVDELSYRFTPPQRDDVIVFRYPKDTTKFFIKRIIGLPGETLSIDGSAVTIKNAEHPDGFLLAEPFVENQSTNQMSITLGPDEYFVMGDNRIASSDSRIWGTVPKNLIIGRVFVRLLPLSDASILPGNFKQVNNQ